MSGTEKARRIELLDALRGFCIILMLAYHFAYDLYLYGYIPHWLMFCAPLQFLQPFFAGVFILISGISSRFARSNTLRGVKVLGCALLVTVATYIVGMPVLFGILHLLGCSMLIYGLCRRAVDAVPAKAAPFIWLGLFAIFWRISGMEFSVPGLWWLGFATADFYSADYFPLLPWIFIFFLGTWAGRYIREGRLPQWFYEMKIPALPVIGRHSLIIYLVHQPVLSGLVYVVDRLLGLG